MKKFESKTEWYNELDDIYGSENWECAVKSDDGYCIAFYRTAQWTKSFRFYPDTNLGEV